MSQLTGNLALAVGFFTRLPLPGKLANQIPPAARLSEAAALFPVAGFAIGLSCACALLVSSFFLPMTVSAGLAIALGLLITGALHEDGFADCADGFGATRDKARALEIMRDSRIGTYGTLALLVSVGLRWAALASLAPMAGFLALLISHSGSRAAIIIAMQFSSYARKEGLGEQAEGVATHDFAIASSIAAIIALLAGGLGGLITLAIGYAFAWLVLKYLEHRVGGYTGDGLGAMQQVAEISILISLAGIWS